MHRTHAEARACYQVLYSSSRTRLIPGAVAAQVLEKQVHPLLSGFYDTPFITWLLKTRDEFGSRVFFEDQLGVNRHWLEMRWGAEEVDTLITHYAGAVLPCQCHLPLRLHSAHSPKAEATEMLGIIATRCPCFRSATAERMHNRACQQERQRLIGCPQSLFAQAKCCVQWLMRA